MINPMVLIHAIYQCPINKYLCNCLEKTETKTSRFEHCQNASLVLMPVTNQDISLHYGLYNVIYLTNVDHSRAKLLIPVRLTSSQLL